MREICRMFLQGTKFLQDWKTLGFSDEDLRRLERMLLRNPKAGEVMQGTGRLRKIRFSYPHRGKRGSVRVCYVDFEIYERIYLFAVFAKNEQENLTQAEKHELKNYIERLEKCLEEQNNERSL